MRFWIKVRKQDIISVLVGIAIAITVWAVWVVILGPTYR